MPSSGSSAPKRAFFVYVSAEPEDVAPLSSRASALASYVATMALLTPLPLERARAIAALYGLEVGSVTAIMAGSVNSNFAIEARGKRAFLRIYEEQTEKTAAREALLLEHLAASGVPTPRPYDRIDGAGFISLFDGKPVALFPFCEGTPICQRGVTVEIAMSVGRALRSIHAAGRTLDATALGRIAGPSRFGEAALRERLDSIARRPHSLEVAEACAEVARYLSTPSLPPAATGLIHGDLFRDNVLWSRGSLAAVLDFESASTGSLAFDLMVTVLAWCFDDVLEPLLAASLTSGYRGASTMGEAFGLDPEEAGAVESELFEAARFACARFTMTRITDFELRPSGAVTYKDFRRWRARMLTLERLGKSGLARILGVSRA